MFLGIFYHLQFMNAGSFGFMGMPGFGAAAPFDPKGAVDAWLHSFRMPLFFLISGFFASMMLAKYGLWKYLARRWWRIGAPLLVAFIIFGLLRTYFPQVTSSAFGGMAFSTATQPSPANTAYQPFGQGFQNGPQGGGFGMPGMTGAPIQPFGQMPPGRGFGMTGAPGQPDPGMTAFKMPAQPSNSWLDAMLKQANAFQDWVFKQMPWTGSFLAMIGGRKGQLTSANFHFEHLWFLWYLLLFVTLAPLITMPLGWLLKKPMPFLDRIGRWLLRFNLGVLVLGLVALPAALLAAGSDWTVENPAGFFATLPDCFVQYFSDLPVYFIHFLAGWWFFRLRDGLPFVAKNWLWNLALGIAGFAISQSLYSTHGMQASAPNFAQYRLAAFALYTVGAACSGMGLLGLFQRYLNRPTTLGKYFTDTILWIYLAQLAIIPHILPWIQSDRTSWWEASLAGMVMVTAIALVMFELLIRPTPLVHIFGPANLSRARNGDAKKVG